MPVDHEGLVDYVIGQAQDQEATPDSAAVLRVAMRGLKGAGYNATPEDVSRISDIARQRLGASTENVEPSYASQYGNELAGIGSRAAQSLALGANAVAGSMVGYDPQLKQLVADDTRTRARELQQAEASALPESNIASGVLKYSNPITGPIAALGDTTSKAVAMQDQGADLGTAANRLNLGGTAALGTATSVVPMAATLGMTGRMAVPALMGTSAAANIATVGAQHGLDVATGHSEFAPGAEDYATAGILGAGFPGAHAAVTKIGSAMRTINMDRVVPTKVTPVDTELANLQREADVGLRVSQEQGVGIPQEQLVRQKLLAQKRDADAAAQLQAEQLNTGIKDSQAAADLGMLPDVPRIGTPEPLTSKALGVTEKPRVATEDVTNAHQGIVDTINTSTDNLQLSSNVKQALLTKAKLWKADQIEKARTGQITEVTWPKDVTEALQIPTERNVQKEIQSQRDRLAQQAQVRTPEEPLVTPTPEETAPIETTPTVPENIAFEPPKPAVIAETPSPGRTAWEQRKAERAAQRAAVKTNLEPQKGAPNEEAIQAQQATVQAEAGKREALLSKPAQDFIDSLSPEMRSKLQSSVDHLKANPDPQGDLANLQMVEQGIRRKEAKASATPDRKFFRNDLGKLTEITDRIDPKHYEGKDILSYDKLSPTQQKNADTTVKRTNVTRKGATLNPGAMLVDAIKSTGTATKAGLDLTSKAVQATSEWAGVDAVDRLHRSSDATVKATAERLTSALHHGKGVTQELHHTSTQALRDVAAKTFKQSSELREADRPINVSASGKAANSKLYDGLEGRVPLSGYLGKIKDAVTNVNYETANSLRKAGVSFYDNGKRGKDVLVRHFTDDARATFQRAADTKEAFDNWVSEIARTNFKKGGGAYTPEEVANFFGHTQEDGLSASVRLDPLEVGRKFPNMPQYIAGRDGAWVRMIETDPTRYIHSTVSATARRAGFVKEFANTSIKDLAETVKDAPSSEREALARALDAYNGNTTGKIAKDLRTITRYATNTKQVLSALRTTATAAMDATEPIAIVGQVPIQHAVTGLFHAATKSGRAAREGGIEADIKNLADLHSKGREVAGNVRGFLHRLSLRNTVNRASHVYAYETGRAWGESMRNGTVSGTDEAFMSMNRIPKEVQERFADGKATETDSILVGVAVAQNMTGRKGNLAETGRMSRNETINAAGPLFRQYAENRVRNIFRKKEAIVNAIKSKNYVAAGRILSESALGLGASAAAATAVGMAMKYGIEGLQMAYESDDAFIPFVTNILGGGVPSTTLQSIDRNDTVKEYAQSLIWPLDTSIALYKAATDTTGKKALGLVPAASRIVNATTKEDLAGQEAYHIFRKNEAKLFGSFKGVPGEPSQKADARKEIRESLLNGDRATAIKALRKIKATMDDGDFNTFVRQTMLLKKYRGPTAHKKLLELRDAMGPTAFKKISEFDRLLENQLVPIE